MFKGSLVDVEGERVALFGRAVNKNSVTVCSCCLAMDRQTGSSDEELRCLDGVLATKSSEKSCATHYLKLLLRQEHATAKTTLSELYLDSNRCLFMSVKLKSCNS